MYLCIFYISQFVDEARLLATDLGLQLLLGRVDRPTSWTLSDNPIEVEVDGLTVEVCFRLMEYLDPQR